MAMDGTTLLTNYNSLANKTYTRLLILDWLPKMRIVTRSKQQTQYCVYTPLGGVGHWTFNSTTMSFGKLTSLVPDGPYSALQLGLTVRSERDSRNFISTALNMNATATTDCIAAGNCQLLLAKTGSPL